MSGCYPHWLVIRTTKRSFTSKEDRAQIIEDMFDMCINGLSNSNSALLNNNIEKYPHHLQKRVLLINRETVAVWSKVVRWTINLQWASRQAWACWRAFEQLFPQVIDEKTFRMLKYHWKVERSERRKSGFFFKYFSWFFTLWSLWFACWIRQQSR